MYKFGAHVSISGGFINALRKISEMGGNCMQIFSASPRSWQPVKIIESEINNFAKVKQSLNINPIYFHASYLINLADNSKIGNLSKQLLITEMNAASKLNIKGSIIHLGSYKNEKTELKYKTLISNIKEVLEATNNCLFIIENAGNKKIGLSIEEISQIIKDVNSNRVKVCLDTCHLFAAGYEIQSEKGLNSLLTVFDDTIGLHKLELFHINDSKDDFSSLHDRHENIGQGKIGLETFRRLLKHAQVKNRPFIIEVPGFDFNGPDKKNLDIIKSLTV